MLSIVNKYVNILLALYLLVISSSSIYKVNPNTNNNLSDIYFYLSIPKINLNKEVYYYNNKNNTVDKGIMLVNDYNMNSLKGSLILASHSGSSKISYFKNLHRLDINDLINIFYNNVKYTYKITRKYYIKKNGKFKYQDKNKNIYLITCDIKNKKRQIVYEGTLKIKENVRFLQKNRIFLHKKKEMGYVSEIYISVGEILNGVY